MPVKKERAEQLNGIKRKKPFREVTRLDRQLLLYEIFYYCEEVSFEEITNRIPMDKRMIQRDIADLTDAGLLSVRYSRKIQAYIDDWKAEKTEEKQQKKVMTQRRKEHLERLYRVAVLMFELMHDEVDEGEKFDRSRYKSCKDYYFEYFPEATLSRMYRDFAQLNRIGYGIEYIPEMDFYVMWEDEGLRESFGIVKKDGKLYFEADESKEWERLSSTWEELVYFEEEERDW